MIKVGVIADTHVKDRVKRLHPEALSIFSEAGVDQIWHAGDVCDQKVIAELSEIAPVRAVQGNADVLMGNHFPLIVEDEIEGIKIAMTHGQGGFLRYLGDRVASAVVGLYSFRYFENQVIDLLPKDADIMIFGHIHSPVNRSMTDRLLFNPGSTSLPVHLDRNPTVGILTLDAGTVQAEVIPMEKVNLNELTKPMKIIFHMNQVLGKSIPGMGLDKS